MPLLSENIENKQSILGTFMHAAGFSNITTEATYEILDALINANNKTTATTDTLEHEQRQQFVMMYAILMAVATYVFVHRTFAFFSMCLRASINLHDHIFRGISRATMFFYNNNPSGRILNRFAKDISSIDTLIPPALMDCLAVS